MNTRQEFIFNQLVERCNNALVENTLLVIEVNDQRSELSRLYSENAHLRSELRKALGVDVDDPLDGIAEPLEVEYLPPVDREPSTIKYIVPVNETDEQ